MCRSCKLALAGLNRAARATQPEQFPVADKAYQRMFSIPLFTAMSDEEQDRVIGALRKIVR
jgi:dTDP-4-amino-4,6-dideoxygalactose transaminase